MNDIGLEISFRIENLRLPKTSLDNILAKISLQKGRLRVPSFDLGAYNGRISGDLSVELNDALYPSSLHAEIRDIDSMPALNDLAGINGSVQGPLNIDLEFEGFLSYFYELSDYFRKKTAAGTMPLNERFKSLFLFLADEKDMRSQKLYSTFSLKTLKLGKIRIEDIRGELSLSEGRFVAPLINGSLYRGTILSGFAIDLTRGESPFFLKTEISGTDFGALMREASDNKSIVRGDLDGKLQVRGNIRDQFSYLGSGEIVISNASLGPMPILTPLLGSIYSAMQNVFSVFQKVEIASAAFTFDLKDRKLSSHDIKLSGGEIEILGNGYVDLDGNLNIAFENNLIMPDTQEEENWPTSLRNFITSFGKAIGKAYLRGTLKEPSWEFEYLNHMKDGIEKNLKNFFRNIME